MKSRYRRAAPAGCRPLARGARALVRLVSLTSVSLAAIASPGDDAKNAAVAHAKSLLDDASGMAGDQLQQEFSGLVGSSSGGAAALQSAFSFAMSAADLGIPGMSLLAGPLIEGLMGSQPNAVDQKLAELDRRVGDVETQVAGLEQFGALVANAVNQTNTDLRAQWIGETVRAYKANSAHLKDPTAPKQMVVDDIATELDSFLPQAFQTSSRSGSDPSGIQRWYAPSLTVDYDPQRPAGKRFHFDATKPLSPQAFSPQAAIVHYTKLLALLEMAEESTGLKPSAGLMTIDNHIRFLSGPGLGDMPAPGEESLPEMERPVECKVITSPRYVDEQGHCIVTSTCTHFKQRSVETDYRVPPPGHQPTLCGQDSRQLPRLDRVRFDLLVDEFSDGSIHDPLLEVARRAVARLQGRRSWTPANDGGGGFVGTFDNSMRNYAVDDLFALGNDGSLTQHAVEHFERQRKCPPPSRHGLLMATTACVPALATSARTDDWEAVRNVRNVARIASGWQDVRSLATLDTWSQSADASLNAVVVLHEDGRASWDQLSLTTRSSPSLHDCAVAMPPGRPCVRHLGPPSVTLTDVQAPLSWSGYRAIVSGGVGTLYAIDTRGDLYWIKDLAPRQSANAGSKTLVPSLPAAPCHQSGMSAYAISCSPVLLHSASTVRFNRIGEGWGGIRAVTAGSDGVIYAIDGRGNLLRYRHTLWANDDKPYAAPRWEGRKPVAAGWDGMKAMAADSKGNLYAITASGNLMYYEISDRTSGMPHIAKATKIASGWGDYRAIFLRNDSGRVAVVN